MFPCNSVCSAYRYCQSNAYCRLVGFEEVYNTAEHGQHPECCPPAIDDAYVDFMRPKLHATKFSHRTVIKLDKRFGCINDQADNCTVKPKPCKVKKKPKCSVKGAAKKESACKTNKLEPKECPDNCEPEENNCINLQAEYGKIQGNAEQQSVIRFQTEVPKDHMEGRQCSQTVMNNNNQNCSESDFQYPTYSREVKSDHSVSNECKGSGSKCYCNWCKNPIVVENECLSQKSSETDKCNKRTIGGSEEGNAVRKKISWMDTHEAKLHKNLRSDCSSNHICRMEVINEEPEENCENNINAQYAEAMREEHFSNTSNNFQSKHSQSVEGRYAEIFIMMHDNIMKSVSKSMENMMSQYCNKTIDQVENMVKRVEYNEYIMEKIYDELLSKIVEQNKMYSQQIQNIYQYIAENEDKTQKQKTQNSHHSHRSTSTVQQENSSVNVPNMQRNSGNNMPSGHQSRCCSRHPGGGLTNTNAYYDQDYHRSAAREASLDTLRKFSNYASPTSIGPRSISAVKSNRIDARTRPFDLSFAPSFEENRSCHYRNSECDHKSEHLDHHKPNYYDKRHEVEHGVKTEHLNMFEDRMERDSQQYYHQRRQHHQEPDIQRMFSEYANGVFAKTYHNKVNSEDNTFSKFKDMAERSESKNRKKSYGEMSGIERMTKLQATYHENTFNNNINKDKPCQSTNNSGKLNTHFVYPSQRKVAYTRAA